MMTIWKTIVPLALVPFFAGCSSAIKNVNPIGQAFPSVAGQSLNKEAVAIPGAYAGKPTVLLVGYVQETQFDLDRWAVGLTMAKPPAHVVEVPTIPGLVPSMISGWIDSGMRSGIPKEDWASVVCVYGGDAKKIVAITGNEQPRNGRIFLLDAEGKVVWFHDRGFSAGKLTELDAKARELSAPKQQSGG
jgi:hypothetical protein